MSSRTVTGILIFLLLILQGQLWFGQSNIFTAIDLTKQIKSQNSANIALSLSNNQFEQETRNLQSHLQVVERIARSELDMIMPNEIRVKVSE
jgi:cell division protein FtsB